ncbi:MAG TPA: DUF5131 family protein [Phycisphaerae bacterium]|nr:DUF5131 family protein [Phycisphaerae bacterium]
MANTLKRSRIGYNGTGADGRPVERYYGWNPGGFGCSMKCDGCWALALGRRLGKCPKCKRGEVHLHRERLCQPANTKRPGVVLVNFTCDTFDEGRPDADVQAILDATVEKHTNVFLTKNPSRMKCFALTGEWEDEHYLGCTIRNQADADEKMAHILSIPGKKWLSLEPLWNRAIIAPWLCLTKDGTNWARRADMPGTFYPPIEGVLIGHDNRPGAPGTDTLAHIRSCVEQCKAAGVNWWVKQIWAQVCDRCGRVADASVFGEGAIRGKYCAHSEGLGDCVDGLVRPRLLRASHPSEYALFPEDLKSGRLPWSAPKEHQNV